MKRNDRWMQALVVVALLLIGARASLAGKPAATASAAPDGGFVLCEGLYALCTTALCTPVAGTGPDGGLLACKCSVHDGYSAGQICKGPRDTPLGKEIFSRYHPIQSYVQCNNSRPWAWCLDVPCLVDADNPLQTTATCSCRVTSTPKSPYVAVTELYSGTACTTGIISSAAVQDMEKITKFFYEQRPPPVPIKVLTGSGK